MEDYDNDLNGWTSFNDSCRLARRLRRGKNEIRGLDISESLCRELSISMCKTYNGGWRLFKDGCIELDYYPKAKKFYDRSHKKWLKINFKDMDHFFRYHYGHH